MAVCIRGSRRGEYVNHWEVDGACRRTTNGGRWRRTTVASARIRMTGVKRGTRRFWPEATRDSMPCSAVAVPMMASMHDWKPTDSTGRHQRGIRPLDGSTTLVEAGKLCIVKAVARSTEPFPFGVSRSDDKALFRPNLQKQFREDHGMSPWKVLAALDRRVSVPTVMCNRDNVRYTRQFRLAT